MKSLRNSAICQLIERKWRGRQSDSNCAPLDTVARSSTGGGGAKAEYRLIAGENGISSRNEIVWHCAQKKGGGSFRRRRENMYDRTYPPKPMEIVAKGP